MRYRNIEERFKVILGEIKSVRSVILDIVSAAWLDSVVAFKRGLRDVENMVKNWIDDIFEQVLNVEEGIEALRAIARFSRRPYLRKTLNEKWIQIWKIFGKEAERRSEDTNSYPYHPSLPPLSGQANILRSNKISLTRQYEMLTDASDWFDDCDAQKTVTRKYKRVLASVSEKEGQLFSDWEKSVGDKDRNFTGLSTTPIVKHHSSKRIGTITVNIQMAWLDQIREVDGWSFLSYDAKAVLPKDCPKWRTLRRRYNKVEYLCKMYNSVVTKVTDRERLMFRTLFEDLEENLVQVLKKTTWTSEILERVVKDFMEILTNIRQSLDMWRTVNFKVDSLLEKIATVNIVGSEDDSLKTLEENSEEESCHGVRTVGKYLEVIMRLLLKLRDRIHVDFEETARHWNEYISEIHEKTKNSIVSCTRSTLLSMWESAKSPEASCDLQKEDGIFRVRASLEKVFPVEAFALLFGSRDTEAVKLFFDSVDQDLKSIEFLKDINQEPN